MRIELHHDVNPDGTIAGVHVIHTERAAWNSVQHPDDPKKQIDLIDYLAMAKDNSALLKRTGWDRVSNHPNHAGMTHHEIILTMVKENGDEDSRKTLGV
jgi:hypothetical protein